MALVAPLGAGENWPQFRGPDGQGHADANGLPLTWSETQNVVWKTAIPGRGWSSPVIEDDRIWLTTAADEGRSLRALCIHATTGRIIHDIEVFRLDNPPPINAKNSYASPTPIVDVGQVFVHFGTFGTACLDAQSGKILWKNRELRLDHKEGPGGSPALCGELLIMICDGIDVQYVAALDRRSGSLRWKTDRSGPVNEDFDQRKAYSTPLLIDVNGQPQAVCVGADRVIAYDPATGAERWWAFFDGYSTVPRPVHGHGLVYFSTGYNSPELWAIRADSVGNVTESGVVWRYMKQMPTNPSPILVGSEIYVVSDRGVATCLDALTGRDIWVARLGGNYSASPIHAAGRIYFFSEDGETHVVRSGTQYELLATNQLDGQFMASPAVVGQALILRTDTHLYRIEQGKP